SALRRVSPSGVMGNDTSGVRSATPTRAAAASRRLSSVMSIIDSRSSLADRRLGVLGHFLEAFAFLFLHPRDIDDLVAGIEIHQLDALGVAAADANAFHRAADDDAALGDHHQLVLGKYILEGDELAGLFGLLHGDDALAAAVLHAVVAERAALANAAFAHHQQFGTL